LLELKRNHNTKESLEKTFLKNSKDNGKCKIIANHIKAIVSSLNFVENERNRIKKESFLEDWTLPILHDIFIFKKEMNSALIYPISKWN
jgi:hypothetical protein